MIRYKVQVTPASSACEQALTPHCRILHSSIDDSLPKQNISFSHIGPVPTETRYNCIIRKYSFVCVEQSYLLTNLTEGVDPLNLCSLLGFKTQPAAPENFIFCQCVKS